MKKSRYPKIFALNFKGSALPSVKPKQTCKRQRKKYRPDETAYAVWHEHVNDEDGDREPPTTAQTEKGPHVPRGEKSKVIAYIRRMKR